jgi:hypothetical protein
MQRPPTTTDLQFAFDESQAQLQAKAWDSLPILNAWKQRYPDQDAVALHERFWHTRPVCPGGGTYVWNDRWQTYESMVYGHRGGPKSGSAVPPALKSLRAGNFGMTSDSRSLRARVFLERTPPTADEIPPR